MSSPRHLPYYDGMYMFVCLLLILFISAPHIQLIIGVKQLLGGWMHGRMNKQVTSLFYDLPNMVAIPNLEIIVHSFLDFFVSMPLSFISLDYELTQQVSNFQQLLSCRTSSLADMGVLLSSHNNSLRPDLLHISQLH